MAQIGIWTKVNSKIVEKTRGLGRNCVRGLAAIAIVASYGIGHTVAVVGVSGLTMTASTSSAQAWWRRGWGRGWGRGWRRGWGYRRGW